MTSTPGVAAYFDLSFQHASGPVLRRMRRSATPSASCICSRRIRDSAPAAGARSNVIIGSPGETRSDVTALEAFLTDAGLDAVGVFGYSDEDGTEAAGLRGKLKPHTVSRRVDQVTRLAEELTAQRAEARVGSVVTVLVESVDNASGVAEGRAEHQAPEVDGTTTVRAGRQQCCGSVTWSAPR